MFWLAEEAAEHAEEASHHAPIIVQYSFSDLETLILQNF